jgi:hypothetical protein
MATDRNKLEQMRSLVKAWRNSGTGQKAFCATQHINIHTFKYWVEKIDRIDRLEKDHQSEVKKVSSTHKSKGFIPLKAPMSLAHTISSRSGASFKTRFECRIGGNNQIFTVLNDTQIYPIKKY